MSAAARSSIAIVGAGMAGASAARALDAAGFHVAVFDKGRGVGGRMATRRLDGGLTFDHGAQYFTAHDPGFARVVQSWTEAGIAAPWGEPGWSVGTPGSPAPVRSLLTGLPVTCECAVSHLTRDGGRWVLSDAGGARIPGTFDAVLVTAPAPQALALAATAGADGSAFRASLDRVRYAPCWALMLAYQGEPPFLESHRRKGDPCRPIAWIARDVTKPGRSGDSQTLVVHASPDWSRAHLEHEATTVAGLLSGELRRLSAISLPAPGRIGYAAAHRWRYARVEQAAEEPCLWSPDLRLGIAGDGCLGGRVEAAYLSGKALAERVMADLPR
jgi:hypothetical protein